MPKRLPIAPKLDSDLHKWVRSLLRNEMKNANLNYRELAERLVAAGMDENERNLANKIARGELPAATFLLCLDVMNCNYLKIERPLDETDQWSIERALTGAPIIILDRDDAAGVFRIRVGVLSTPVTILLQLTPNGRMKCSVSHMMLPPTARRERFVHIGYLPSPGHALASVLNGLTGPYKDAIDQGQTPSESWLVPMNLIPNSKVAVFSPPIDRSPTSDPAADPQRTPRGTD